MPSLAHKRGTRAQIDAAAGANALRAGEVYLITDEARLTVGTAANAHSPHAKQSEAGGIDPWTYVKLTADAVTAQTTSINTALAFTPDANSSYEVEGKLYIQTAATTTGARPGISWPSSGIAANAALVIAAISNTAFVSRIWGGTAPSFASATGVAVANQSLFAKVEALFSTGGTVSGDFIITLSSEVAASEARIMAGSFIRYRKIP